MGANCGERFLPRFDNFPCPRCSNSLSIRQTVTIALATLLTCLELTVSGGHAEGVHPISLTSVA
jgi:hypothetical protein